MSDFYDDFHINQSKIGVNDTFSAYKVIGTDATEKAVFYHAPFYAFSKDDTGLINNTTTFSQYLRLNFDVPQNGLYEIKWHYVWSLNNNANDFRAQVQLDDNLFLDIREHKQEPKDSAGTGETLPLVGGGTLNSGTNQRTTVTGFDAQTLVAGSHFVDIDIACSLADTRAAIYGARISVVRVG